MSEQELYEALSKAGFDFEIMQIFEDSVWLRFNIDREEHKDEDDEI
jgi:hypothetical protein